MLNRQKRHHPLPCVLSQPKEMDSQGNLFPSIPNTQKLDFKDFSILNCRKLGVNLTAQSPINLSSFENVDNVLNTAIKLINDNQIVSA